MTSGQLLLKLPIYKFFHRFNHLKPLPFNYTFLISTKCNSRCKTCNIWKQKHEELRIDEWKKLFQNLGNSPFWATISGGEPFLQPHLADMVVALDRNCHPAIINIPTNSLLPDRIKEQTVKILKNVKGAKIVINLSLDGIEEVHDKVRGVPGNFSKVIQNYKNLKKLQKRYPNLTVGFGTVISEFNLKNIHTLFDYVFNLEPDQYVTEIAEERVELGTVGKKITPNIKNYSQSVDYLQGLMKGYKFSGIGKISRAFRFTYYQFVKDWLSGKKLLPDFAGFASVEITSWGEVWTSCIKGENMGNIKDTDFDFKKVWFSKKADQIREKIKDKGTSYPLANAYYSSALLHLPTLLRVGWRIFR